MKCVFCEKEFEKLSCEHIIPNVLCGHLKSHELLCTQCNSCLGNTIDKLLNGEFDMIINLFGLERENGRTPPVPAQTESGRSCLLSHGGQPIGNDVQISLSTDSDNHIYMHINAPENNTKLLKMEISKFIANNKSVFSQNGIDYKNAIPEIIKKVSQKIKNNEAEYLHEREKIQFQFCLKGIDFYRPVLKILYLFLLHYRKDAKINRKRIMNIINSGENICDIFFYCFSPKTLFVHKHISLYHSVGIKSFRNERKLIGFIDLFGITPYICILDDNYDGEDICISYGYDLLRKQEECPEIVSPDSILNLKGRYGSKESVKERLANHEKRWSYLLQLYSFYSIPEIIIQGLLATVHCDSDVSNWLSELKPQLQEFVVANIDRFLPLKEEGYSILYKSVLFVMRSIIQKQ